MKYGVPTGVLSGSLTVQRLYSLGSKGKVADAVRGALDIPMQELAASMTPNPSLPNYPLLDSRSCARDEDSPVERLEDEEIVDDCEIDSEQTLDNAEGGISSVLEEIDSSNNSSFLSAVPIDEEIAERTAHSYAVLPDSGQGLLEHAEETTENPLAEEEQLIQDFAELRFHGDEVYVKSVCTRPRSMIVPSDDEEENVAAVAAVEESGGATLNDTFAVKNELDRNTTSDTKVTASDIDAAREGTHEWKEEGKQKVSDKQGKRERRGTGEQALWLQRGTAVYRDRRKGGRWSTDGSSC